MSPDATGFTSPEAVTLLLALDLLARHAEEQRQRARKKGNHVNRVMEATMIEMSKHIEQLRAKLKARAGDAVIVEKVGGREAEVVGEACVVASQLKGAAVEAERQSMPAIGARMLQAADCIERLVSLLSRR